MTKPINNSVFVNPAWVKERMENHPDTTVLLDFPYGKNEYVKDIDSDKRNFVEKHIPGAIYIDKTEFEGQDTDLNIRPKEKIEKLLLSKGIDKNSTVIAYSDGIIAASRVAFIVYWLGVSNVKILNGGIQAWEKAGYPLESGEVIPIPKEKFGLNNIPLRPEIVISTPDDLIKEKQENPDLVIASVRSWDEFYGGKSGYPYIEGSGSPLGSVHAEASTSRINVENILDDNGRFGNLDKIFREWEEWGITPEKDIAFFCGAGWRAATAFFIAKEAGYDNVKVYDGGWYQYNKYHQKDPEKYPIQVGDPRDESTFKILDK